MGGVFVPKYESPAAIERRKQQDAVLAGALAGARAAQQAVINPPLAPTRAGAPAMPGMPPSPGAGAPPAPVTAGPPPTVGMPVPGQPGADGGMGGAPGGMPAMPSPFPPTGMPGAPSPAPAPDAALSAPGGVPGYMHGGRVPRYEAGGRTDLLPNVVPAEQMLDLIINGQSGGSMGMPADERPMSSATDGGLAPTNMVDAGPTPPIDDPMPDARNLPAPPQSFLSWLRLVKPGESNEFGDLLLQANDAQPGSEALLWEMVKVQANEDASELPPELARMAGGRSDSQTLRNPKTSLGNLSDSQPQQMKKGGKVVMLHAPKAPARKVAGGNR